MGGCTSAAAPPRVTNYAADGRSQVVRLCMEK
jgi:hypothetical protein